MTQLQIDILKNLTYKYLKIKYQGNAIGFIWSFITPAVSIFAYYFAFTYILQVSDENHLLYLIAAVIHWRLFSTAFPAIANSFIGNKDILQKISINRLLIPLSVFLFNVFTFIIMLIIFMLLYHFIGGQFTLKILIYPVYLFLYLSFIFGLGIMMTTLSPRFRDIPHMIEVSLMLLFWFTPIIYNYHIIPKNLHFLIYLNPFATFIVGMEQIFYDFMIPSVDIWVSMISWTIFSVFSGYYIFVKYEYKALEVL